MSQIKGVVRWFNNAKGYGFLGHDGGPEVFVHYSSIQHEGYRSLKEGEEVAFEIIQGTQGPQADHVSRLKDPSDLLRDEMLGCVQSSDKLVSSEPPSAKHDRYAALSGSVLLERDGSLRWIEGSAGTRRMTGGLKADRKPLSRYASLHHRAGAIVVGAAGSGRGLQGRL